MSDRRRIAISFVIDGTLVNSETVCVWAGPYILAISTTLPDVGFAIDVHSSFVGAPGVSTLVTHLNVGPAGHAPFTLVGEHDSKSLNPQTQPRECALEHAAIVLENLTEIGHEVRIEIPDTAFQELERIER